MTEPGPDERSTERADELLPEELRAGSDDPLAQAAAVLAESDERAGRDDATQGEAGDGDEHRRSEDTVDP